MGKENLTFADTEIEKNNSYNKKTPVPLRGVVIYKVLASKKIGFDEKAINTLLVVWIMIVKLRRYI